MWRDLRRAAFAAIALVVVGGAATIGYVRLRGEAPVPPILQNLSADQDFGGRLSSAFPSGTQEDHLIAALGAMEFQILPPSDQEPSVRRARFQQGWGAPDKGFYRMVAWVYWEVDASQQVVWTRGTVGYSPL